MKQLFRALVVAVLLAAVGPVGALGLGKLEKNSALNERFSGRIPLVSVSADEISTLQVGLADESAFERADVVYAPVLRDLKFKLVEPKTGQDYIQITSSKPIREPFLNFLVELNWASGRIFREYTVLLDPPLYDPQQQSASTAAAPAQESPAAGVSQEGHQVNYPEDTAPRQRAVSPASAYSGGDYGPIQSGDTLWSIANEMKPAGVTTHQMMLALLRANPDAFIGNNINGLKRGAILQRPDRQQMNAVSQSEALAQVKNQHGLWDGARQAMAAEPGQRADTTTAAPATDATAATGEAGGESGSRLELVGTEEGATGQTGDTEGSGQTAEKLAIANENLESLRQENAELKDRLVQNEALIEDLKRLIALKNDELASLQGRTAEEAAGTPSAPAGMVDMVDGVNYPSGDPSQFINETAGDDALLPGAVPPEEPLSHTVNRPADAGTPATTTDASGDETAGQTSDGERTAAEPAPATASEPAQPTPQQPAADDDGIVDMLMGYVATARTLLLNNLMIVGAVLLAIIALLAGSTYMRRRQARVEEEADAAIASGTFPDFNVDDAADQTSFEDDAESATELNAATATAADDDATEIVTGSAAEAADDGDDDLFVVPQGEQEPQPSADEDDEDPLAEVNVLMAYEHFDQAESFVRNALKSEPNNVEYQAKLLEVFYAAGNKKKYEEAASDLRDMTGGEGEHWDMAVAMWQEMSPNRALFEGGGDDDDQAVDSTGGGGIVDITGDTAGGSSADPTSDTGGSLDFDLGDSTGGGSAATSDDSSEMLDITASEEASGSDDMLDLTAAESSSGDDDMLDMTAATSQVDDDDTMLDMTAAGSIEANQPEQQSGSDSSEDDGFEFSLGDDDQNDSDLLDVTQSGSVESDEDLLDVTSSGSQASQSGADDDDDSLDFSLDMDSGSDNELDSEAMTAPGTTPATADDASSMDELEAGFDFDSDESGSTADESADSGDDSDNAFDFDLDIGEPDSTGEEQATSGSDEAKSDTADSYDMDLEIQEDSDSNDLDEIGDELDRLEQTLGTLSHKDNQDATKGFGNNTSDALDGIDSALEDMETELGEESEAATAKASDDAADDDNDGIEMSLDDGTTNNDKAESADELDLSLDGFQSDDSDDFSDFDLDTNTTAESGKDNDDTSSVSLESTDDDDFSDFDLDFGNQDDSAPESGEGKEESSSVSLDSSDDDLTSDLSGFDFDLDSGSESDELADSSEAAEDDISAELSEISQQLDSGDLESAGEDANNAGGPSMDFDLDAGEASGSGGDLEIDLDENAATDKSSDDTQTMQMNATDDSGDETDFSSELDLDLSTDDMSANEDANESIDMDSTVELPKDKLSGGLSLASDEEESDDNDDEDATLFVGRSSDTEEQSLEDELTTKLDLAKAYVELGDSDSARGILEEVMKDGNDDQKRQAGELLGQL